MFTKEKLNDKFESGDKVKVEKAVQDALVWLGKNRLAESHEFKAGSVGQEPIG